MALSNLTKVQTLGIGSNIEVVGVITTGQFKSGTSNLHSSGVELTNLNVSGIATIGGNVSIGGTLTYQDVTNIDSVGIITARSTIDAQGSINLADSIIHTGDTNTKIRFPTADTITAETAGTERLRIDSSGRIGVGVVPTAQFAHNLIQIGHQATLGANAALSTTGQTFLTHNLYFDTGGTLKVFNTSNANEGAIFRLVDGQLLFSNSTATTGTPTVTERLRITSDGTIGINENSPSTVLHVKHHNNDSADIRIEGGGSGNAGIQFIPGGQTNSYFAYVDTNRNFRIQDHASERLRIASDGDMGVGTNSPSARLHVNGGDGLLVERSGGTSVAGFKNTGASAMNIYFQNSGSTNHPYIGSSNQDLTLGTNNLERLRITSGGLVLIGTTTEGNSSADNLTVADSGESGITVRSGTSNGGHIYFSDATSGTAEYQGAVSYQHNGDFMKFNTGATERMRIQSNGYMALNTTGAQRLFSVKESNNKASILIWRTSESNADYSGIDFIGHPSNNGTNYQKGGIYWQTDGSGFGRGDMVFCNDGAADSDNVIISNEKLRIHKEGPVTKPNMPVASFSDSRAVDISNSILTSSNFYNHQWWNEGSHFNTSNGRFTCPVDGVYRIYFRATCDQNEHTNVRLRKNGSTINEAYASYSSGQTSSDSSEAIMHCSTNDYLEIQVSRLKTLGGTQHKQVTFQLLH